jgi:hydroxylaminobenzene mutase
MNLITESQMLILATLLFLLGLLTGVAMPLFRNKRMGLSAHLVGVQHGIVLWIVGLIMARLEPSPWLDTLMTWSLVLGLYGLWLSMLLAAIWGASRALPMAGEGHQSTPGREGVVTGLVYGPALLIIVGIVILLWRLL